MPAFPQVTPPYNELLEITLHSGAKKLAYFDPKPARWMTGVDGQAEDEPIDSWAIASWERLQPDPSN